MVRAEASREGVVERGRWREGRRRRRRDRKGGRKDEELERSLDIIIMDIVNAQSPAWVSLFASQGELSSLFVFYSVKSILGFLDRRFSRCCCVKLASLVRFLLWMSRLWADREAVQLI